MKFYKQKAKSFVTKFICASGLLRLFFYFRRNEILIFMTHGVLEKNRMSSWVPGWQRLSEEEFELGLKTLTKYFTFISIDDAIGMIKGDIPLRPYSAVMTFDDGYANNLSHAYPIAKKYQVPCCFYIATHYIQHQKTFWLDRLDYALQKSGKDELEVKIGPIKEKIYLGSYSEFEESYRRLRLKLKKAYTDDKKMLSDIDEYCESLESESGNALSQVLHEDLWTKPLYEDQLKNMPDSVVIGSHTVHHYRMPFTHDDSLRAELEQSKQYLEKITEVPCKQFCYPNGDYTESGIKILKELEYESAVTTEYGTNNKGDDLYRLKRISFPSHSVPEKFLIFVLKIMYKNWIPS